MCWRVDDSTWVRGTHWLAGSSADSLLVSHSFARARHTHTHMHSCPVKQVRLIAIPLLYGIARVELHVRLQITSCPGRTEKNNTCIFLHRAEEIKETVDLSMQVPHVV